MSQKPLTKQSLREAFDLLDKAPLKVGRIFMDETTFEELSGMHVCEHCSGQVWSKKPHTVDECNVERARQVVDE